MNCEIWITSYKLAPAGARIVRKDANFKNTQAIVVATYKNITKCEMKEKEAAEVIRLRNEGHELPYNREKDNRYKVNSCRN